MYQPKTGERCSCRPGVERDNCPACEGTGQRIDFAAIRARSGKLASLHALHEKRGRLLGELERSLAIRALWPGAFAHGRCTSAWIGAPTGRDRDGIHYALRLRITDGAGNAREFLQSDVPTELWPDARMGRLPESAS